MLRRCLTTVLSLMCVMCTFAYNIKGTVNDDMNQPLPGATIRLLAMADSAFVKGARTTEKGTFTITGVKKGKYIVEFSYIGYANKLQNVDIVKSNVDLPVVTMSESDISLQEVTVTGVKAEIKVKEDTVEYNADSYKTQPNSVVQDLLKRLPGVEVDSEGKITANGKEVKKILVDGKEFFSDDPQVASKNLPVTMVDKLQVVDRKSDLARITGVDDGEEETVINLTVKKGMKNGYFGNVELGYGTDERYKGMFNVNRFWNDNQITFLGNFNNVNESGFSEGGGGFRRFGGTNGINTSQAFGLNFNVGNKEIFRIGGELMYSHSDRFVTRQQERQYMFADSTSYSTIGRSSEDNGHNVRAGFRMQWNPDSFNTLEFRPNIRYNVNDGNSLDSTLVMAGDASRTKVSRSFNTSDSHGTSISFGADLIYNHRFRSHPGRSYSVQVNYDHSNRREKDNSYSYNMFYLFNDSIDLYDQYTNNRNWSDNASFRATWTEPLGDPKRGHFATLSYRMQYRWNNADKLVYDHPIVYPEFGDPWVDYDELLFNSELSNRFRNDYFNQDIRLGYKYVSKTANLDAGMSAVPTMSESTDLINSARNIPTRWVWNYAPYIRYRHRMSKTRSLNVHYNGRTSQPSMSQLQPVADMSDPLRVVIGNPNLDPTFSHSMNVRFQDFNMEAQRSIMVMGNFSLTQNSIVSKTTFDSSTGGQVTTYENVNGVWNGWLRTMFSTPFRNKNFQFNNHFMAGFNQSIGFNNGLRNRSQSFNLNESMGLSFRPDDIELELRPYYRLQSTHNSVQTSSNRLVHSYGGMFRSYYYTPIGLILESNLSYTATRGYSAGYDQNQWMWNASISYQTLKSKALTFSMNVYDILQQRSNISRNITANYIDDTRFNALTRYFMFSVSYKFTTFGKGKNPSPEEGPGFGPGSGHGPGRGGFGGPGGGPGRRF